MIVGFVTAISMAIQIRFSLISSFDINQLRAIRRLAHQFGDPFYGTPVRTRELLVSVAACLFTPSDLHKNIKMRNF